MKKTIPFVTVRAMAEYQLWSDTEDGAQWMRDMLQEQGEAFFASYKIHDCISGPWGIRLISFTVDVNMPAKDLDNAGDLITEMLNKTINDTDVEVRWVGRLS